MKERRSFWDVPRVTRRCRGRPSRIYANRVGPLCPSSPSLPSSTTTKRSRSNFHPVRNFYFSSNETTKGGQSLASSARGGIGQEGDGGRGASGIHLFRDVQQRVRGTVSFLRQSIQLPRNRHRRWEDGKRQEGLLPPPFLSTPFLLSTFPPPLLEELDSLCLPPRNAREK